MPYAKNLQEYVKKYAPQAELVIQQTWAYRFDDNRLKSWKMSQREMFDKLVDAYDQAAAGLGIRLIPTGEAVQLARETQPVKYVEYDREALKSLKYPDPLPSEAGSFAVGMSWGQRPVPPERPRPLSAGVRLVRFLLRQADLRNQVRPGGNHRRGCRLPPRHRAEGPRRP